MHIPTELVEQIQKGNGERLERTTSRLELANLLAEFLQKLDPRRFQPECA
jgi:hypothetical protein